MYKFDGLITYKNGYGVDNSKFLQGIDLNTLKGFPDSVTTYAILGGNNYNAPTAQNGYLTVYNSTTRDRITQTYKSNESFVIYERVYQYGVWESWYRIEMSIV